MTSPRSPSLHRNFILNALLSMSAFVFPLITFPYISRVLQPEGVGHVTFALSVVSYFSMLAQLGIPTYGIRACATVREDITDLSRTTQELLIINSVTMLIAYGIFAVALFTVPALRQDKPLFLIVSAGILLNTIGAEWLFKALEQYTYITVRSLLFKCMAVAAMFLLVHEQKDYRLYGALSVLATGASGVCNFLRLRKHIRLQPLKGYHFRPHLKAIVVFFAMSCAATVYTNLDTVMLGLIQPDAEVGFYSAAIKVKTMLVSAITSLGAVLLPRSSYYARQGRLEDVLRLTGKALRFVLLTALPLLIFFTLFARETVLLLSGDTYLPAVLPMQIIMPTLLFIGLSNLFGMQLLVPLGRETAVLLSEGVGAVVDLVLNLWLIPRYGAAGAAAGTVVAELSVCVVQGIALRSYRHRLLAKTRWWVFVPALAAGCVGCLGILPLPIPTIVTLALGAAVFFGLYGGVLVLLREPLLLELLMRVRRKS